ncbi:hypothetical protein CEXT_409551 [Caerostris extrusa]|uniref:Uncharacterized protein n=1 Tax=Caerostris extrusa TaxID=172846 RepID=A0AAV4N917_CAEEX|nr:hypothetical protein CEXT_409551 [Caerostris extrusa]
MCQEVGHTKEFCSKGNAVAQVTKTDETDSEIKGLNGVKIEINNTGFDGEIPVGETDGKFLRIHLGVEPRKHKKNSVKPTDDHCLNQRFREAKFSVNEVSTSVLAYATCSRLKVVKELLC